SQRMHPAEHSRFRVLDIILGKKVFRLNPINRIDGSQEVALISERHSSIDPHSTLKLGIRCSPLFVAGRHSFRWHERLSTSTRNWVKDISTRIHPCRQTPHYVIH